MRSIGPALPFLGAPFLAAFLAFASQAADVQLRPLGRPTLGIAVVPMESIIRSAAEEGLPKPPDGLAVAGVEPFGPAVKSGLRQLDILTMIAGQGVKSTDDYLAAVAKLEVGKTTNIRIVRAAKKGWQGSLVKITPVKRSELIEASIEFEELAIEQVKVCRHRAAKKVNQATSVEMEFILRGGRPLSVNLIASYVGKEWLFFDTLECRAGEQVFRHDVPLGQEHHEIGSRGVYEWQRFAIEREELFALFRSLEGNSFHSRLAGRNSRVEDPADADARRRLLLMLDAYRLYGGELAPDAP